MWMHYTPGGQTIPVIVVVVVCITSGKPSQNLGTRQVENPEVNRMMAWSACIE